MESILQSAAHGKESNSNIFIINHRLTLLIIVLVINSSFFIDGQAQSSGEGPIHWRASLDQPSEWYKSPEAIRIADNVLLYQDENGGWPKNIDMAKVLSEDDKTQIRLEQEQGKTMLTNTTIDNGTTTPQMRYLARVYDAAEISRFKDGFLHGVDYLLEAQYENGGWPQFYPIRSGYWQRITFNDNAMISVMNLLRDIDEHKEPYTIVDQRRLAKIGIALEKGLDIILKTQIVVDGKLTAWCAQYDEVDLSPQSARSYEHVSISGSESVGLVRYLMGIENPSPDVIAAIENAVTWFEDAAIHGIRMTQQPNPDVSRGYERIVVKDPAAEPLWARFYDIETNRPIFSGRDGVIKYDFSEIEHERQVGYTWYGTWPRSLLENDYPEWRENR